MFAFIALGQRYEKDFYIAENQREKHLKAECFWAFFTLEPTTMGLLFRYAYHLPVVVDLYFA